MTTVSTVEASQSLDSLLERVRAGEEVSISDGGREVARLVPPKEKKAKRRKKDKKRKKHETDAEWLERLRVAREAVIVGGEPISETVIRLRREARY